MSSSIQPVPSSSSSYHPTNGFAPTPQPPQPLSTSLSASSSQTGKQSQPQDTHFDQPPASRPALPPVADPSLPDTWYLKPITLPPNFYIHGSRSTPQRRTVRIITQNLNGPCSFIAICNILILRGDIKIEPEERRTVSYEFLAQLVAEWLLKRGEQQGGEEGFDVSAALSVMPMTQKGMDLNPVFTALHSFRPSGATEGGELKLFAQAGIQLVHGWLVDPESQEGDTMSRIADYDTAVGLIAEVDHLTQGRFVVDEENLDVGGSGSGGPGPSSPSIGLSSPGAGGSSSRSYTQQWTDKEERKVKDAIVVRRFLDSTQGQLTYHGLFQIASSLPNGSLVALFRNSHLSVLYKTSPSSALSPNNSNNDPTAASGSAADFGPSSRQPVGSSDEQEGHLYTLVTDQVFLNEPSVVWERLEDIDGGWSTFVDGDFIKASPAGGDFAGQSPEEALRRAMEREAREAGGHLNGDLNHPREDEGFMTKEESADLALARQLQADEDRRAQAYYDQFNREQEQRRQEQIAAQQSAIQQDQQRRKEKKKKGDCIIM